MNIVNIICHHVYNFSIFRRYFITLEGFGKISQALVEKRIPKLEITETDRFISIAFPTRFQLLNIHFINYQCFPDFLFIPCTLLFNIRRKEQNCRHSQRFNPFPSLHFA